MTTSEPDTAAEPVESDGTPEPDTAAGRTEAHRTGEVEETIASAGRADPNALSTAPDARWGRRVAGAGPVGTVRRWWRQLTSMRTALLLLFLLAVAAAPGSLLPQHSLNENKVNTYYQDHPDLAPILDKLGLFDVFSSPWFAAIYLLLLISLLGCVIPRTRTHARAMLRRPPDAPRYLRRLRVHDGYAEAAAPGPAAERAHRALRARRFRSVLRRHDDGSVTVSAEKGFLRETGNLLFHLSLIGLLLGVALGSAYGWHGGRLLMQGRDNAFCDTLQQYDQYSLGARVHADDLPPFCLTLNKFHITYQDNGQPLDFHANVSYTPAGADTERHYRLSVNHPLKVDGTSVYLVGRGYAPVLRYTDRYGQTQTTETPFLPSDTEPNMTSNGVAVFPDANVDPKTGRRNVDLQVAFQGVFFPTVSSVGGQGSTFPGLRDPAVLLFAYRGNTGTDAGIPHSVYTLDQSQIDNGQLKQVSKKPKLLRPGQSWTLDDGTRVQFVGVHRWMSIQIKHDPGIPVVAVAGGALLLGLLCSLSLRRRRLWFRFIPDGTGSVVDAGGLARTEYAGFGDEFARVVAAARGRPAPGDEALLDDEPEPEPKPESAARADAPKSDGGAAEPDDTSTPGRSGPDTGKD